MYQAHEDGWRSNSQYIDLLRKHVLDSPYFE